MSPLGLRRRSRRSDAGALSGTAGRSRPDNAMPADPPQDHAAQAPDAGRPRSDCYRVMRPRRMPRLTASVRVAAPSLPRTEATWNFAVCSLIRSRSAIRRFERP
jgi:hypothetical protein